MLGMKLRDTGSRGRPLENLRPLGPLLERSNHSEMPIPEVATHATTHDNFMGIVEDGEIKATRRQKFTGTEYSTTFSVGAAWPAKDVVFIYDLDYLVDKTTPVFYYLWGTDFSTVNTTNDEFILQWWNRMPRETELQTRESVPIEAVKKVVINVNGEAINPNPMQRKKKRSNVNQSAMALKSRGVEVETVNVGPNGEDMKPTRIYGTRFSDWAEEILGQAFIDANEVGFPKYAVTEEEETGSPFFPTGELAEAIMRYNEYIAERFWSTLDAVERVASAQMTGIDYSYCQKMVQTWMRFKDDVEPSSADRTDAKRAIDNLETNGWLTADKDNENFSLEEWWVGV